MFELIDHNRKSIVVVLAAVDIIRMYLFVVVVVVATVDIYQDTQICWCVMYHLVQLCAIRRRYGSVYDQQQQQHKQ